MRNVLIATLFTGLLAGTAPAMAEDHSGHMMHDHAGMEMQANANEAMGSGMLHGVDAANNSVNITHAPIPELGWPEMTMDLPTTNRVDLSGFQAGDQVQFTLKKGRDNQFRITEMSKMMGGDGMGHHHH